MKPYKDVQESGGYVIREFDKSLDPIHLLWHRDDEDRLVEVLESGTGWKVQLDDELPQALEPGTSIFILRHQWHRVVKRKGSLILKIHKK